METPSPQPIQKKEKEYDVFKDSWLRFVGYSNEFGEALRKVTSTKFVISTYVVEIAYFMADVIHKNGVVYNNPDIKDNKGYHLLKITGYTLLWQCLATCFIPAFFINIVVRVSHNFLVWRKFSPRIIKYTPMSIGLAMIPFSYFYVDPVVGHSLDHIFDKHL
jgi:hypothetical protein